MNRNILKLVLASTVVLLSSCSEDINDKTDELRTSAIFNSDSTVQIKVERTPFRYSCEISRNEQILDTLWGEAFNDETKLNSNDEYTVRYMDEDQNVISESQIVAVQDEQSVGLLFPTKNITCILGTEQLIRWNPESFPSDSVVIKSQYTYTGLGTNTEEIIVANSGSAKVLVERNGFFYETALYGKRTIAFSVKPAHHPSPESYEYSSENLQVVFPDYTYVISYPSLNDTISKGRKTTVSWYNNALPGETVLFALRNGDGDIVMKPYEIPNSGTYEWVVPNIENEYFCVELLTIDNRIHTGHPFYVNNYKSL